MSDCSKEWKLPKKLPAEVRRVMTKGGERYGLRVGSRRILMTRYESECVLSDLMVLLNEREADDGR